MFHPHREHQEAFARERPLRILREDAKSVITGLRRMATQRDLRGQPRREIETVCGYFEAHLGRMQYDEYLAAGCPIATGVIEGASRHLVKDRMERHAMDAGGRSGDAQPPRGMAVFLRDEFGQQQISPGIPPRLRLRDSGAEVRLHPFHGLKGLFFGHAPKSMADRSYTQPPKKLFDRAIRWPRAQYGIEKMLKRANRGD